MTRDVRILSFLFVFLVTCAAPSNQQDQTEPKFEAIYPKGFRVTLQDDGYSFFGFRGNINKEFKRIGEGDIMQDIVTPNGGKWIYKNRDAELKVGDTVYYWIYLIKNGKGQMVTNLQHTVTGFVNEDGTPASDQTAKTSPGQTPTPSPNGYNNLDKRYDPTDQSCSISKTMVQGRTTICKDAVIFSEEFDKPTLRDLVRWDSEVKFPGEPDYPFNMYIPDNTVSFEDGSLVITPLLTESQNHEGFLHEALDLNVRCTGKVDTYECKRVASGAQILPPVITAKITTRRSFNFKFGKVEVRAKLPSGSWLIPEINLESSDYTYGPNNYESGLMRVAFARGNPSLSKKLYGGPVLSDREPFRSLLLKEKIGIDNWFKDFHNYTMIWKPDGIELLVDGEQYGNINPGEGFFGTARQNNVAHASHWLKGTVMAPLDEMFHVTLGLRVGGVNDFNDDLVDKPWKNRASKAMLDFWKAKESWHPSWYNGAMKVDYVRVFAL